MKKIFISILILLAFNYCAENVETQKEFKFKTFPAVHKLEGKEVNTLKNLGFSFIHFEMVDSLLIVKDPYNRNNCLYIVNKNNFELIAKTGKRGKGPREISSPGEMFYNPYRKEIWLIDGAKYKTYKFNLKKVLDQDDYLPKPAFKIKEKLLPFWDIVWLSHNKFAVVNTNNDKLITIYDEKGKKIGDYGKKFHKKKDGDPLIGYKLTCNADIDYSKKTKEIFMSFVYFDKIVAINLEQNHQIISEGPKSYNPEFQYKRGLLSTKKLNRIRGKTIVSNNFVFSTYYGKKKWRLNEKSGPEVNYFDEIHIFDLKGKPIAKIKLDRQINEFIIDNENKRIIAHGVSNDKVVIYNLQNNNSLEKIINTKQSN